MRERMRWKEKRDGFKCDKDKVCLCRKEKEKLQRSEN